MELDERPDRQGTAAAARVARDDIRSKMSKGRRSLCVGKCAEADEPEIPWAFMFPACATVLPCPR